MKKVHIQLLHETNSTPCKKVLIKFFICLIFTQSQQNHLSTNEKNDSSNPILGVGFKKHPNDCQIGFLGIANTEVSLLNNRLTIRKYLCH